MITSQSPLLTDFSLTKFHSDVSPDFLSLYQIPLSYLCLLPSFILVCVCSEFIDFHALFYVDKHSLVILLNSLPRIPPNLLPLESIFVKLVSFEEVIFP